MARRRKYPTPPEQLTELAGRARARGLTFDEFWAEATRPGKGALCTNSKGREDFPGAIIWPSDSTDARAWQDVMYDPQVIACWRRAYEGVEATPSDRALEVLGPALRGLAA